MSNAHSTWRGARGPISMHLGLIEQQTGQKGGCDSAIRLLMVCPGATADQGTMRKDHILSKHNIRHDHGGDRTFVCYDRVSTASLQGVLVGGFLTPALSAVAIPHPCAVQIDECLVCAALGEPGRRGALTAATACTTGPCGRRPQRRGCGRPRSGVSGVVRQPLAVRGVDDAGVGVPARSKAGIPRRPSLEQQQRTSRVQRVMLSPSTIWRASLAPLVSSVR